MDWSFLDIRADEWLNIAGRWFHVVSAIFWVGTTAFFSWMDRHMAGEVADPANPVTGELWMVHSGGFYRVEKQRFRAGFMPQMLHWFKWEAAFTWLSGVFLLWLMFYRTPGALAAKGSTLSHLAMVHIGLGTLLVGFLLYDLFWNSPLGRNEWIGGLICFAALMGVSFALSRVMDRRVAYIHVGALLGTIMAGNVWMRIIPGQRRIVRAVSQGTEPDLAHAKRAKQRSQHNTFLAFSVVFLMLSSGHFSGTYGQEWGWALLGGFVILGWIVRRILNLH